MNNKIEIIRVEMPDGTIQKTDLATIKWVEEFGVKYPGGTIVSSREEIMKIDAAHEYLKQQGSAR